MKKLLLTTAAAAILASSSAYAATGDFYLKANAGWSQLNNLDGKLDLKDDNNLYQDIKEDTKSKAKNTGFAGVAVGYYMMDNVRFDLAYDHFFDSSMKGTLESTKPTAGGNGRIHTILHNKVKLKLDSLLLNFYVDMLDLNAVKIFAGAGAGVSRYSAKITASGTQGGRNNIGMNNLLKTFNVSRKIKTSNDLAYALYLGASTEFTDGVHGDELTYSFRDFGEIKVLGERQRIRSNQVSGGIRFDL
ncbi:MAG: hypothetical protein AB8B66_05390 [Rickettsiaceae bacterium]